MSGPSSGIRLILIMAMTADGYIARDAHHFPDWTEKADKELFARRTREAGVVIMGSRTFDVIGRPLPGRLNIVMTRRKERLTGWIRQRETVDLNIPVLQDMIGTAVFTDLPPEEILKDLEAAGYTEAALIGGAVINSLFAGKGLISEILLSVSPYAFGKGVPLFSPGVDLEMELLAVSPLGAQMALLHYRMK